MKTKSQNVKWLSTTLAFLWVPAVFAVGDVSELGDLRYQASSNDTKIPPLLSVDEELTELTVSANGLAVYAGASAERQFSREQYTFDLLTRLQNTRNQQFAISGVKFSADYEVSSGGSANVAVIFRMGNEVGQTFRQNIPGPDDSQTQKSNKGSAQFEMNVSDENLVFSDCSGPTSLNFVLDLNVRTNPSYHEQKIEIGTAGARDFVFTIVKRDCP